MLLMLLLLDVKVSICLSMRGCRFVMMTLVRFIDEVVSSGDIGMLNGSCAYV